jgi:glutamate decarboxylase
MATGDKHPNAKGPGFNRARFITQPAPDHKLPDGPMDPADARLLIEQELLLDGDPEKNLATFVTTWMGPDATALISQNLHTNFIDHAEYPQTAEIEQRCIRMLADLFHAPGETTGARTQGSSEAIMLGALSLKWRWRTRQQAAGRPAATPNLVFGGDVHVVWEKFCRYFDVEPRIVPLRPDKYTIGPEDVEPFLDENTIGVAAVLGTTFTGHRDDIVGINDLLVRIRDERDLDIPLHVDGASGGFVWPFLYPDSPWDFRLEQVRSINASGHKFGLVYPGVGWVLWRSAEHLPEDLVFHVNYLGGDMPTFALNFSRPGAQVVLQYFQFLRLGREGYRLVQQNCQDVAVHISQALAAMPEFSVIADGTDLPVVTFTLSSAVTKYDVFDLSRKLREHGWLVPAYTMPPKRDDLAVLRVVVRNGFSHDMAELFLRDLRVAIEWLDDLGSPMPHEMQPSTFHH